MSADERLFLAERYVSGLTGERLAALAARTAAAALEIGADGARVAYVGSAAVPLDETCFCLFRASSVECVELVFERLEEPCERIVPALAVALHESQGGTT